MTEKEKAKAYDKAIERAKKLYGNGITEEIFPELKEDDTERIRKNCIHFLELQKQHHAATFEIEECIDWLEKQGEQKPCMVQWKGDNLKEVIGFTGKDKNFEKWFKSFEEYEKYVHEHNDIFKLFNENGSHYEIPVGAWIVKTPDGYNIASNAILKQKSADKIEPTFNVDDWVVNKFGDSWHIDSLDKKNYQVSDGKGNYNYFPISKQDEMHLWTIQNGKDGDILACNEEILLFKSYSAQGRISLYCWYNGHTNNFHGKEVIDILLTTRNKVCPATKEQRDALMKAMNDAGYEWDAEKKELKKEKVE